MKIRTVFDGTRANILSVEPVDYTAGEVLAVIEKETILIIPSSFQSRYVVIQVPDCETYTRSIVA